MTGRRATLILLTATLLTATAATGCLETLQGAVGGGDETVWATKANLDFNFAFQDALAGASPRGVTEEKNFTVPLGAQTLRAAFDVTLETPGNVTVRLSSPSGVVYEESFSEPGEHTRVHEDVGPETGQWRVQVQALGNGAASARVDARVPAN